MDGPWGIYSEKEPNPRAMDLDFSQVATLEPEVARALIPFWLQGYVQGDEAQKVAFSDAAAAALATVSDAALRQMLQEFGHAGKEYRLYPASAPARAVSRAAMATICRGLHLDGLDHLRAAVAAGPCLLLSNHLSYVDTTITDLILHHHGATALADALVVVAGPKVYSSPFRRLAAISLNTLHTAQSSHLATNEAGLTPREVGRIALQTLGLATERMAEGQPVLLYAEGSRTRTGRLQPFLRAVSKYLRQPGLTVVPLAISGSDDVFPLGADQLRAAEVRLTVAEPLRPEDPQEALAEAWRRIAQALPERYQPEPGLASTPLL